MVKEIDETLTSLKLWRLHNPKFQEQQAVFKDHAGNGQKFIIPRALFNTVIIRISSHAHFIQALVSYDHRDAWCTVC